MTFRPVLSLIVPVLIAALANSARGQAPQFEGPEVLLLPDEDDFMSVARGDLDGDGDARDVVGVASAGDVFVFLRTGNAAWAAPIVTPTSQLASVFDIELADVDGDGDLDLVAANANVFMNSVTVLRNNGSGSFLSQVTYPVGAAAVFLALADYDLDGDVDIAVTVQPNGGPAISQFKVLKNQGTGVFAAAISSPVGPVLGDLHAIDVDLDGDFDLVSTEPSTHAIRVFQNAGNGSFPVSTAYAAGAPVQELCALDVDGDGDQDLAAAASTAISVLTRASDGSFPTFATYPIATSGRIVAFDADGDGGHDLAVNVEHDRFAIVKVTSGALQLPVEYPGSAVRGLEPADYDGDGDQDLLIASLNAQLMHNAGDGRFFEAPSHPIGGQPRSVRLGDLDGDGDLDTALVNRESGTATVFWNPGDGSWSAPLSIPLGTWPFDLQLVDLDSDLDLDLAIASDGPGLMVVLNLGGGSFGPVNTYSAGPGAVGMDIADLDGDGDLDAILVESDISASAPSIWSLSNAGDGSFGAATTLGSIPDLRHVAIGDWNADGIQDLVFSRAQASGPIVLQFGVGGGAYGPVIVHALGTAACSAEPADLDGDGDLDLGVRGETGWHALLNDGSGTFASSAVVPMVGAAYNDPGRELVDLDGDGDLDLVIGVWRALATVMSRGDGTFDPPQFVGLTRTTLLSLAVGDLDSDGDHDVAYTSFTDTLTLVRGCRISAVSICAGDGSAAPCPCGNASAPGSATGCANSFGLGGSLRGSGPALLTDDRLRLESTQLPPTATALYFQGTAVVAGGQGSSFGDGLRCVGGSVIRLGTKVSAGGASSYPGPGDPGIVARGVIATPGMRLYQVWYRNSAAFCTASTFNMTNAVRVTWNL